MDPRRRSHPSDRDADRRYLGNVDAVPEAGEDGATQGGEIVQGVRRCLVQV